MYKSAHGFDRENLPDLLIPPPGSSHFIYTTLSNPKWTLSLALFSGFFGYLLVTSILSYAAADT